MERTRKVIGVSMLTLESAFQRELKAGLEQAAQGAGYDLIVNNVAKHDTGGQTVQVAQFAAKKTVDAIVITPCNSASVGLAIEQANRAGIPVFTVDIASDYGQVVSHIASDNVLGGRKAGELMSQALGGQGNIVIATRPGVSSVADRVRGFKEVVSATPGLRLFGEFPIWSDARKESARLFANMLAKTNNLNGVFCINDEYAMGVVAAVEAAGRTGEIAIVGYDATEEAQQAIKDGQIYGDVVQHPTQMAAQTIGAIRDHFAGKPVPALILTDIGVYTAAKG
jgi:ribose transport system substrate-binding protein